MFLSHLRESSGSAADPWPAKMDENDILSQQNITNLKPKFSLVPALSMWGGQEKQPQPCSVWSLQRSQARSLPGMDTHLQAAALLLCQLTECPNWAQALPAASWHSPFEENLDASGNLASRKPTKKENFNSHPETYASLLNFVVLPDSTFSEHSYCPQSTISARMIIAQRGE